MARLNSRPNKSLEKRRLPIEFMRAIYIVLMFLASTVCYGQSTAGTNFHFWTVGSHFQIIQYDQWEDARGYPCEATNAVQRHTYTTFASDLPSVLGMRFRVRMPAWGIVGCLFGSVSHIVILFLARLKLRKKLRSRIGHS